MQVIQKKITSTLSASEHLEEIARIEPDLLLVFASPAFLTAENFSNHLRLALPNALMLGCSTAGEITRDVTHQNTCILTGIKFDHTRLIPASTRLAGMADSFSAGVRLGNQLASSDLQGILLYAPGVNINGSALVNGLIHTVGQHVKITGGLAGDNDAFTRTFTIGSEGVRDDTVVAVGLTGHAISISHGSCGGWLPFGPPRRVTRCDDNILFELDGEPALEVYKRYLGDYAENLPASGLLFPFAMHREDQTEQGLIRTILGVNKVEGSLTLAGDIDPQGYLKLMHASTERLVSGAVSAAESALVMLPPPVKTLAILVSCVGRRLVMGERVDEEIEAVVEVLGKDATVTGFYAYGEICPAGPGGTCELHNQTMTITCLTEV